MCNSSSDRCISCACVLACMGDLPGYKVHALEVFTGEYMCMNLTVHIYLLYF